MADVGDEEDRTEDNESPSTNQHLELLPLEKFKSPVWNHSRRGNHAGGTIGVSRSR